IKVVQNGSNTDGDFAVFGSALVFSRLEEISLLRAEALVALNRGAEAIVPYNEIILTRGLTAQSYLKDFGEDDARLLNAILDERGIELVGQGCRWYDMIRGQELLRGDGALLNLIENGGIYWPVATDVLNANSSVTQKGYLR